MFLFFLTIINIIIKISAFTLSSHVKSGGETHVCFVCMNDKHPGNCLFHFHKGHTKRIRKHFQLNCYHSQFIDSVESDILTILYFNFV